MRNLSKSVLAIAIGVASFSSFASIIPQVEISDLQSQQSYENKEVVVLNSGKSSNNTYTNSLQTVNGKSAGDTFHDSTQIVGQNGISEFSTFHDISSQTLSNGARSFYNTFTDNTSQDVGDRSLSLNDTFSGSGKQQISSGGSSLGTVFKDTSELNADDNALVEDATFQDNSTGFVANGAHLAGVTTLNNESNLFVAASTNTNPKTPTVDRIVINDAAELVLTPANIGSNNGTVSVGDITLNGGSINFDHEAGSSFTTLKTNMLSGTGGTLIMNGNLAGNNDVLDTKDMSGSGEYTVQLNNTDSGAELDPKGHELLKIGSLEPGANPTFKFSNGEVDQGVHKAEVKTIKTPDGKLSVVVAPNLSKTSNSADAVMGLASASQYVFDGEMQALRTRHGDVQQGNGGVWARYLHNSTDITAGAGAAFSLGQNGMEVGADKVFALADGKLSIGALTSYSKSSVNQRDENSHVRSMGAGLYSTYVSSAGYYVDGVVKFNHFNNDLRTRTDQGQHVKGSYSQNGIGASLEAGYKYALGYGLNLDPYVRTTYFAAKGKDITLSNGLKADIGTQQSAKGELGVSVGKTFQLDHVALSPYVTVAVEHEFLKDNKVTFNDRYTYKNDQSGTLGKYGAGLTAQLAKNTQAYAEVDYRKGDKVESPIMANIGVRVNF